MKILERGKSPQEYTYHGICVYCKTQISFTGGEAELVYDSRDGDYYSIKCPLCKNKINSSSRYESDCGCKD